MSQKTGISLRHINSFLIFYALDTFMNISTTNDRNRIDLKINSIHFLACLVSSISFKKKPKDNETIELIESIFEDIEVLRVNYEGKIEDKEFIHEKTTEYQTQIDSILKKLINIIIDKDLIQSSLMDLEWGKQAQAQSEGLNFE